MIEAFTNKYFINGRLKEIPYIHSKAKILAYAHFFALLNGIGLYISSLVLDHAANVPLLGGSIVVILLMAFFKYKGDLVISGNLLSGIIFVTLFSAVSTTGGIYSDNLLWMLLAPMVALLFASRPSGIFWTVMLIGVTIYFYLEEIKNVLQGNGYSLQFDADYYFLSYGTFFISIVFSQYIFVKEREHIIDLLVVKNKELETNKIQQSEQQELLIQQKKALESLSQELKNSNGDLENFANAAAHDMKQPLRMIKSYLQLIEKDKELSLKGSTMEYMNFVMQSTDRLDQLLSDLLDLSQVGKEKNNNTIVSLNDVMIIVKNNLSEVIKENNAVIQCDNLPEVYASKSLIIQLFQNLIANGIKFQKKGTLPVLTVKVELNQTEVIVEVKDNGIGIKEENQQRVFKIFERLHTQDQYEGSGIGLHTCKKIMDSMNKRMWLSSTEGQGTSFFLTLPLMTEEPVKSQSKRTEKVS